MMVELYREYLDEPNCFMGESSKVTNVTYREIRNIARSIYMVILHKYTNVKHDILLISSFSGREIFDLCG